jgi:orotate phosphoribosyltransferase
MNRTDLAKKVFELSHITGEFLLRSGQTSQEYFDKYRFEAQPEVLKEIARQLAPMVPPETEILAGLEMGGIPVATALSFETGIPVAFIRKEAKSYGTCQFAEGSDINGKRLCLIEDVVTTGGQVLLSTDDLRNAGAIVKDVLCVIYRGQGDPQKVTDKGLSLQHLFTMQELKDAGA